MYKVVRVEEMQAIEAAANRDGMSYADMMENAGRGFAHKVHELAGDVAGMHILILAGPGNNGGDGLVAAHHLKGLGASVCVYLSHPRAEGDRNVARLQDRIPMTCAADDPDQAILKALVCKADMVVDALLGTGFRLPMRPGIGRILAGVNAALQTCEHSVSVAAVDCPSGLECDSGCIAEEALQADWTVTFAAAKFGHFIGGGPAVCGRLMVVPIGLPDDLKEMEDVSVDMMEAADAARLMPARPRDSHKGTFGTVCIIAGSLNYPGAPVLAASGAYRAGSGLVRLAVPLPLQAVNAAAIPEAVWTLLPHELGVLTEAAVVVLLPDLQKADAVVLGPGLGREPATLRFVERLFNSNKTSKRGTIGFIHGEEGGGAAAEDHLPGFIIDADALRLLAQIGDWAERIPDGSILTPHPGEMACLAGLTVEAVQAHRVEMARTWAQKWGHVLVLKGAFTVVAAPDGRSTVVPIASSALATAGSGDVLSGVIAALRAQGADAYEAALLGVYLHARAGELAEKRTGWEGSVMARDVAEFLGWAAADIHNAAR